jgi:hypothetical protein
MMKTLNVAIFAILLVSLCAFGQSTLPRYAIGAGLGFDSNAPVSVTAATAMPGWTQQINGWGSFAAQVDTKTYSYSTVHAVGNAYTLTTGVLRVLYQSGNSTLGTIADAGVISSSNATGGTGNLGGAFFYDLGGVNKKLNGLLLTGIVKGQYTSVSPAPAAGYSIHPVFEFGLTFGLK